jgi:ribonuclease Y
LFSADAISASRPGARGESLEHYIKRLEALEAIASSKKGVEKVYALQAGREVRVMVKRTRSATTRPCCLPRDRARDRGAQYPGQIKGDRI